MESFTGMTYCLAHLDINDANEKEIPEIDQSALGKPPCNTDTTLSGGVYNFLFVLIVNVSGKSKMIRKGCLCGKSAQADFCKLL